jgi:hypothetical protein
MLTPIQIAEALPRNVGARIFMHFKHPTVEMIEDYWREPEILKKNWMIAQLNRYNWLTHSDHLHNYGKGVVNLVNVRRKLRESSLKTKIQLNNILDPCDGAPLGPHFPGMLIHTFPNFTLVINNFGRMIKKLWKCNKRGIKSTDHNEWKMRSLFGGVYPINPWTGDWNIRWKKDGDLRKLIAKKWDRQPWRMCQWEGAGTIVKKLDGSSYVYMGPLNMEFIPNRSWTIDPYL